MESSFKFASASRPTIGYVWERDYHHVDNGFFGNPPEFLSPQSNEYDTYGDGTTQHSPLRAVRCQFFTDFLYSLALFLVENPSRIEIVASSWYDLVSNNAIEFYSKLTHSPDKEVYYNPTEYSRSTSKQKQYDTRWKLIPEWADGSIKAIFNFLNATHYGAIERFKIYQGIRKFYNHCLCINDATFQYMMGFDSDGDNNLYATQAFEAIDSMVLGHRTSNHAIRMVECLTNNLKSSKE